MFVKTICVYIIIPHASYLSFDETKICCKIEINIFLGDFFSCTRIWIEMILTSDFIYSICGIIPVTMIEIKLMINNSWMQYMKQQWPQLLTNVNVHKRSCCTFLVIVADIVGVFWCIEKILCVDIFWGMYPDRINMV